MQHRGSKPELEPFGATGEDNFRGGLSEADSPVLDLVARGKDANWRSPKRISPLCERTSRAQGHGHKIYIAGE